MSRCVYITAVLAGVAPQALGSQAANLPPAESASLRVATVTILLDSLVHDVPKQGRIWIGGGVHFSYEAKGVDRYIVSDTEWQAISQVYSGARRAAVTDTVFLCPDGVKLQMPGSGCPIREGGIVIDLQPLQIDGDTVMTGGYLIRSYDGGERTDTWALSARLVFERFQQNWRLRAIRSRGVT
jgi:hypothetical protein